MNRLLCLFAAASLTLAALVFLVIVREHRSQWRPYQQEYKTFLRRNAATPASREAADRFTIGYRQDWLPDFKRADRCRSCHIGVANPAAPAKAPLAPHPDADPHTLSEFGCTICHGGEGYATRLPDAHEELVPLRTIESGCGKCHDSAAIREGAPTLAAGRNLADRYNCNGCHRLAGRERRRYSGPALNGLAAKVSAAWLSAWLKNPKGYLPHSRMGNFLLNDTEINELTAYLLSGSWQSRERFFSEDTADEQFLKQLDDDAYEALIEEGKVQFGRLRCLTCHALNGRGGSLGPELEKIGRKTSGSWIGAWLRSPADYDSRTIMPAFRLTRAERLGIAEYLRLESEYLDEDGWSDTESEPQFTREQMARGADLFISRGCFNCHVLEGVPDSGEFAPSLADLADKKLEKLSFGTGPAVAGLPDYIAAKLQAPRLFGDNLKMPLFDLPPAAVGRLTTFALAQSSSIPPAYQQQKSAPEVVIGGEVGKLIERYRCLSCHMINGRGGSLAPDLSAEGSRVQRQWLIDYLQKPYAIQPTLSERMLRFNMTTKEAGLLADYITLVLRDKAIDDYPAPAAGDPEIGRALYHGKYACQTCHAIGTGGGYFGPALDRVGRRLTPNWMNGRLENSHLFNTSAREPVLAVPAEDRSHLVAFLAGLRDEKP